MSNLGKRLKQARKAAGLSLRALGALADISHMAIKKFEDGVLYPSSDVLLKLAKAVNVRADFFLRPVTVSLGEIKFRTRKPLSRKVEETIRFAVTGQIERRLELENLYPSAKVSSVGMPFVQKIRSLDDVEQAAEKLREHWKLGSASIHDLTDVLENHGVRVFVIDSDNFHFDGLLTIVHNQPMIVISSKWNGDQQRFNLAHELAHCVLHGKLEGVDEEEACNRFAGAFLFPREIAYDTIGQKRQNLEWQELLLLKEQYQMSIGAMCDRIKDLGIIKDNYYKQLMAHYKKKGWNEQEPGKKTAPEKAHVFQQMVFHALGEDYIGESKAAELLQLTLDEFRHVRLMEDPRAFAD